MQNGSKSEGKKSKKVTVLYDWITEKVWTSTLTINFLLGRKTTSSVFTYVGTTRGHGIIRVVAVVVVVVVVATFF